MVVMAFGIIRNMNDVIIYFKGDLKVNQLRITGTFIQYL
jgi:hypothetical protein